MSGIKLLGDCAIRPHFEPDSPTSYFQTWARENTLRVLCLPEKSGIAADEVAGRATNSGPADVLLIEPDGTVTTLKANQSFSFQGIPSDEA
jgi:hypothetical protein